MKPSSWGSSVIRVPQRPLPVVLPQQPQASRFAGVTPRKRAGALLMLGESLLIAARLVGGLYRIGESVLSDAKSVGS